MFLVTGSLFGLALGVFAGLVAGWRVGLEAGITSGALFGLALAAFLLFQRTRLAGKIDLEPGERLLKEGPANHFVGVEAVGGWLYLTNRRLHFRSHASNVQVHEWGMPLEQLGAVEPARTAGIVPNGLKVTTRSGDVERLVVNARAEWVRVIQEASCTGVIAQQQVR
jgi:hypothetical protein